MDKFNAIANTKIIEREGIFCREPEPFEEKLVKLENSNKKFDFTENISTKEELYALLDEAREKVKPFLADYCRVQDKGVTRREIKEFEAGGKTVVIPDYGGPTGNAVKTYVHKFDLDKKENKHYRIYFQSVDYIAFVYINGCCVGTHEGFFGSFFFDITNDVKSGENELKIVVKNDFVYLGNEHQWGGEAVQGDKLYAATGPGWDDPEQGWHHCPPGFGIIGKVYLDECDDFFINDIFVRVLPDFSLEAWVDVYDFTYDGKDIDMSVSVYGQNFEKIVFENMQVDLGAKTKVKNKNNIFKVPFKIKDAKIWNNDTPWLYKIVVEVRYGDIVQVKTRQFGVRTFTQDVVNVPKGKFYLNGKEIKLRGANTMGFEQQDVMNGNFNQLIDDILLAKLCNMNFLRLTQRPVQEEIYDYCDRLGIMIQTDLPLFGVMRKTKFAEGVRQAEEMEKLVRSHPCCIVDTFINEPFANGRDEPHRHMTRDEMEDFFAACKLVIKLNNPERVVKSVDGDYDPPCDDMPDNHCYNFWYNNHAVLLGRYIKGYWLKIKKDWCYGCGEFGTEGLDPVDLMKRRYPKEWIREPFDPCNILKSQTGTNGRVFYPKQNSIEEWVEASQNYQAFADKMQAEFFRRDPLCVSFAVHLFIDAWPAGWMKTIMDCERTPKKAYFAYRNALTPVLLSFRTDRTTFYDGETVKIESYLSNDLNSDVNGTVTYVLVNSRGETVLSKTEKIGQKACGTGYVHTVEFKIDGVEDREKFTLKGYFTDGKNESANELTVEIFGNTDYEEDPDIEVIELNERKDYFVAGGRINVYDNSWSGGVFFIEIPQNELFAGILKKDDIRFLYNKEKDQIDYVNENSMKTTEDFKPILTKYKYTPWNDDREDIISYKRVGKKIIVVTTIYLRRENPAIKLLLKAIHTNLKKYLEIIEK